MEPFVERYHVDGGNFAHAGEASIAMKKTLRGLGVSPDAIRKAAICMYEGEINMVIHASGGEIEMQFDGKSILMILRDNGPGIGDTSQALKAGYSTATAAVRDLGFGAGMGLPNMCRYADEFDIHSEIGKGTAITMRVKLETAGN